MIGIFIREAPTTTLKVMQSWSLVSKAVSQQLHVCLRQECLCASVMFLSICWWIYCTLIAPH